MGGEKAGQEAGTARGARCPTEPASGATSSWNYISEGMGIKKSNLPSS